MFNFKVGASYTFNTYAPAILGNTIKNAVLSAIVNYATAKKFGAVDFTQSRVFSYLPAGTPNDPQRFTYLIFKTESDAELVLAVPWINESTIETSDTTTLVVRVRGAGANDARNIKELMALAGWHQTTITVES